MVNGNQYSQTFTLTAEDGCGPPASRPLTYTWPVGHDGADIWTWARAAGGPGADAGNAVAVDINGNVLVVGTYQVLMSFPNDPDPFTRINPLAGIGGSDIFLAKYNAQGDFLWAARAGGTNDDTGLGVTVDDLGNAYITGGFSAIAMFHNANDSVSVPPLTASGPQDIFVAKYDPNGLCLWATDAGGLGSDFGAGIAWTAMGDQVFVTGTWGSPPATTRQAFILAVSSAGAVGPPVLSSSVDPNQFAVGSAIAVDAGGNPYVAGSYRGQAAPTIFPGGPLGTVQAVAGDFQQMFVVKYDNHLTTCLGERDSSFTAPGTPVSGNSEATGIAVAANPASPGNPFCFVTGAFNGGNGIPATVNFGLNTLVTDRKGFPAGQLNDYFILKLDSSLLPLWAISGDPGYFAADSDDETRGIAVDLNGNPVITGFRHPNAGTPFVNEGPTVLVASYDSITHALRWINDATEGSVAPNPLDVGYGIAISSTGCAHVTGGFTEDLTFSTVPALDSIPVTVSDIFVAKMCPGCDLILPCPPNTQLNFFFNSNTIKFTWNGANYHLQSSPSIGASAVWTDILGSSGVIVPIGPHGMFFRLVCY